jgi:hypothetical protein
MAVKGYKATDVGVLYDPNKKAYREVPIPELRKELEALGFTPAEIFAKLEAPLRARLAEAGFEPEEIEARISKLKAEKKEG